MGVLSAILPLLASGAAAASCEPIEGWSTVLAEQEKRFLVIGELHGTKEIPALFGELACLTGRDRPLAVALEFPSADQDELDAFLASDGGQEARAALLNTGSWAAGIGDGRTSQAMMAMLERLRQLHASGKVGSVIAFVPSTLPHEGFTPQWYERAMAERIMERTPEGSTALVLVGNAHARTAEISFDGKAYLPMSAHLPSGETTTLLVHGHGGTSWNCTRSAQGSMVCGESPSPPPPGAPPARGVVLESVDEAFAGVLNLGVPYTASPPANPRTN